MSVCTLTPLLDAMAFAGTRRPTDTSIQMPLAAYQHLMAEAPLHEHVVSNARESRTIAVPRDTLLPRLHFRRAAGKGKSQPFGATPLVQFDSRATNEHGNTLLQGFFRTPDPQP